MKITDIQVELKSFDLVKPYRITHILIDKVVNCIVKIKLSNGVFGIGAGAPIDFVTGETIDSCLKSLEEKNLSWLLQQPIYTLPALTQQIKTKFEHAPAAAAALDIALYDAYAKLFKLPLVDVLGRAHQALPTSITIGIKDLDATLNEAYEYISQGFKILKIKLGEEVDKDITVLLALNKHFSNHVKIRVDMNQGYSLKALRHFVQSTKHVDIELIEQPFSSLNNHYLTQLPEVIKNKIAADESVKSVQDMFNFISKERLCGIINIKLMKCGGITPALEIAGLAELAKVDLMWGCMDESVISISAALHAALSSKNTKYLDLDGSFDLKNDLAQGGFILKNGHLETLDRPGLGLV